MQWAARLRRTERVRGIQRKFAKSRSLFVNANLSLLQLITLCVISYSLCIDRREQHAKLTDWKIAGTVCMLARSSRR